MKQSHILFNVLGLTIAGIFSISAWGQITRGYPTGGIIYALLVILLVGGGSVANLGTRGLSRWPTITMIVGYFISFFLFPFGIWGIVALIREHKRHKRKRQS